MALSSQAPTFAAFSCEVQSMPTIPYTGPWRTELSVALDAAERASGVILEFYDAQSASTYVKGDGSPVTDADLASDRSIRDTIAAAFPGDALLTEEGAKDSARLANSRCWIVDPIDGTAQYVARTGQFDVMIALAIDGEPVVAATVQPVTGRYQAAVRGAGAWEIIDGDVRDFLIAPAGEPARLATHNPPRLVSSKWYGGLESTGQEALRRVAERIGSDAPPILEVGYQSRNFSSDLRTFDAYVGLPPTTGESVAQEWDLACVDLITREAGGAFTVTIVCSRIWTAAGSG
jgi:hypothetical protein